MRTNSIPNRRAAIQLTSIAALHLSIKLRQRIHDDLVGDASALLSSGVSSWNPDTGLLEPAKQEADFHSLAGAAGHSFRLLLSLLLNLAHGQR